MCKHWLQFIFNSCRTVVEKRGARAKSFPSIITRGAVQLTSTCKLQPFDFHAFEKLPEESENLFFFFTFNHKSRRLQIVLKILKIKLEVQGDLRYFLVKCYSGFPLQNLPHDPIKNLSFYIITMHRVLYGPNLQIQRD